MAVYKTAEDDGSVISFALCLVINQIILYIFDLIVVLDGKIKGSQK